MTATDDRPDEFDLIARFLAPLADDPAARGLIDDAALLVPPAGMDLVLTKDALCAGIHFFADDEAAAIAKKALRVNLSDLAAKGADPLGYLLALALPRDWTVDWIDGFTDGLAEDQKRYGISLLGGDTIRSSGGLMISVTAIGTVPTGGMVPRDGARAGDRVFVSGTIGDAALGLHLQRDRSAARDLSLSQADIDEMIDRYSLPRPRMALGLVLRDFARAAIDVSDGLAGDLGHLCRAAGLSARIELDAIPFSDAVRRAFSADPDWRARAITGGDDYELIAAVAPEKAENFKHAAQKTGLHVTEIGAFETGPPRPVFVDAVGRAVSLGRRSYTHF